jgi:hypothetical protein
MMAFIFGVSGMAVSELEYSKWSTYDEFGPDHSSGRNLFTDFSTFAACPTRSLSTGAKTNDTNRRNSDGQSSFDRGCSESEIYEGSQNDP